MTTGPGYELAGPERARLRTSAADRERAVDVLKAAFTDGRLPQHDYETRIERALSAQTFTDLDALVSDLPGTLPPPGPPVPPRTNTLAIIALVAGIAQFFGFWLLGTIPAVVCGYIARRQIRETGEQGDGMALAGVVLGWVGIGLSVILVAALVAGGVILMNSPASPGG